MPAFLLPFGILAFVTIALETLLWILFHRRVDGLILPRSLDRSSIAFLSPRDLWILGILHTLLLLVALFCTFFFLW